MSASRYDSYVED